jgi:hypothetical protein
VWFPGEVVFVGFEFSADAHFRCATFSAVTDFSYVTFSAAADFSEATFSADAYFSSATFSATAGFRSATFSADADFRSATFSAYADFSEATFSAGAYFISATFIANAYFNSATFSAAADFFSATFSAYAEFGSATFSAGAYFHSATFSAGAHFTEATFSAYADFRSALFSPVAQFTEATFSAAADFSFAAFSGDADFRSATFRANAYFTEATFSAAADFRAGTFSNADFNLSVFFARADFSRASFNDSIRFFGSANERLVLWHFTRLAAMALGKDLSLDFQHVRIEHPDRIAFHTPILRPHWFVNVDSRQFVFTDVSWEWNRLSIEEEIAALEANGVSSPNRLLAIACRQLAENAEANNRYEEASRFRYWSMDLARRTKWKGWQFWKTDWLHMLYWAVSGYGERIRNALGVLAAVWIVFAVLYTQVGFKPETTNTSTEPTTTIAAEDSPRELSRALTYSLAVMSLQKPEPKPLTGTAQTLVLLETILGPVQAALLALAIRRKFMR